MKSSIAAQNMERGQQQMLIAFGLTLLVTISHGQYAGNNTTLINNETINNPPSKDKPTATATPNQKPEAGLRPLPTGRPNQNITLNDLLTALLNIQKNQVTSTENPLVTTGKPVTNDAAVHTGPTTANPDLNDIISKGGVTNQSVIILNIGDLLGNHLGGANQILNGLNGINCQQGYIYVMLPGGQGKFVPLNQANVLPQNGVPSYIILLANGQPNIIHDPNWQQINGMLPTLGINIPGLSKIGSIPIYAPTNHPNSGTVNPNIQLPNNYPNNNHPNMPPNPNNVVSGGIVHTNYPTNPNINFVNVPAQNIDRRPNINIPGVNINFPTPAPQPINPSDIYPNFNIIQQPTQQIPSSNILSNVNIPSVTMNVPNQPNLPAHTGVNIPNMNMNWQQQPSLNPGFNSHGMNIMLPASLPPRESINVPGISINFPAQASQPSIPVNTGINIPVHSGIPTQVNSGITIPGLNVNVPMQPINQQIQPAYPNEVNINGTNLINLLKVLVTTQSNSGQPHQIGATPNYVNLPNLPSTIPGQVGINVGAQHPTGNILGSSGSDISLSKLIEQLGLKLSNVPTRINPEIGVSQNVPESELVNILLKQLGDSGFNSKFLSNDHVRITIEKGQDGSKSSVPHVNDMLLHYINKNSGALSHDPLRRESERPGTFEVLHKLLSKTPNVGNNQQFGSSIISTAIRDVPVIKFEVSGQNVGHPNYVPNVPMNIPSQGIVSGQVAADPQYLATLMRTFSGVNLPNDYLTGGFNNGLNQHLVSQNFGKQPHASMNSALWNYLLAHLGCIPNNQSSDGNYMPSGSKIFIGNEIPISSWQQVPQFSNMGMSFRNKRAVEKK